MPIRQTSQIKKELAQLQRTNSYESASEAERLSQILDVARGSFEGETEAEQLMHAVLLALDAKTTEAQRQYDVGKKEIAEQRVRELEAELNKPPTDPTLLKIDGLVKVVDGLVKAAKAKAPAKASK
ncbi:MAG: hypothetical protein AAFV85_26735 [Cyanobacteria bacterium J06634_6]